MNCISSGCASLYLIFFFKKRFHFLIYVNFKSSAAICANIGCILLSDSALGLALHYVNQVSDFFDFVLSTRNCNKKSVH